MGWPMRLAETWRWGSPLRPSSCPLVTVRLDNFPRTWRLQGLHLFRGLPLCEEAERLPALQWRGSHGHRELETPTDVESLQPFLADPRASCLPVPHFPRARIRRGGGASRGFTLRPQASVLGTLPWLERVCPLRVESTSTADARPVKLPTRVSWPLPDAGLKAGGCPRSTGNAGAGAPGCPADSECSLATGAQELGGWGPGGRRGCGVPSGVRVAPGSQPRTEAARSLCVSSTLES